jgi:hypothetical protein
MLDAMKKETVKIPLSACEFTAPIKLVSAVDSTGERQLFGVAYSGDVITDSGYWDRLAIDLSSTTVDTPIPLLYKHDHGDSVGTVETAAIGSELSISARLYSDLPGSASDIAAKADKGFPWQMSVGIWPEVVEKVKDGQSIQLNGRTMKGPLAVYRNNRVREISVVSLGADHRTSAHVFSPNESVSVDILNQEANAMTDDAKARIAELEAQVARLEKHTTELAAKATNPDPNEFVPFAAFSAVNDELSALKAKEGERAIDDLVKPALLDGRILPSLEEWARELGANNLESLRTYIDKQKPNQALTNKADRTHTRGGAALALVANVPTGFAVDQDSLELHAKATEYQAAHPGTTYVAALQAIA